MNKHYKTRWTKKKMKIEEVKLSDINKQNNLSIVELVELGRISFIFKEMKVIKEEENGQRKET